MKLRVWQVVVVFLADRFLKNVFWFTPPSGGIGNFLHPTLNDDIAFSLSVPLLGTKGLLAVLTLVSLALVFFAVYSFLHKSADSGAWGLIAAGAVSNVFDRYLLGGVLDYIDLKIWPVFNIADTAIVCGVVLLLYRELHIHRIERRP